MLAAGAAQAQGSFEQQQACQKDAIRLCPDAMPDESKIRACLIQNRAKLTPDCQTMMANQRRRPGNS